MKSLLRPFIKLKVTISKKIDKNYLKNKLQKRKGKCKQCGKCCKYCKHLDKTTNKCKVYNHRPSLCYPEFPLDKFDQQVWNIKNCGYSFD